MFLLVLLTASACVDSPNTITGDDESETVGAIGTDVIYFGYQEVKTGALKSSSGVLPRRGETATLELFVPELAWFVSSQYLIALTPHLFVRYRATDTFQEVPDVAQGGYIARGPYGAWDHPDAKVPLAVPADADRIEVFVRFDRVWVIGASCYLGYDVTECPDTKPADNGYVSNYARNFMIAVAP